MPYSYLLHSVLRGKWFIDFRAIEASGLVIHQLLGGRFTPGAELKTDKEPLKVCMLGASADGKGNQPGGKPEEDKIALVPLHGVMLKYTTECDYGTDAVADAIRKAAVRKDVSGILLDIDSGGGAVDAIAPITDAIRFAQSLDKPVVAYCDLCASAAYYAAVYCDSIIAGNTISSEFGSIGVMMQFMDYAKYYDNLGIKEHIIYSDLSEYKNDAYEAARKGEYDLVKKEMLNPLALNFQEAVKTRRGDVLQAGAKGILSGKMFYAESALKNGLIDGIGNLDFAMDRVYEIRRDKIINNYAKS